MEERDSVLLGRRLCSIRHVDDMPSGRDEGCVVFGPVFIHSETAGVVNVHRDWCIELDVECQRSCNGAMVSGIDW